MPRLHVQIQPELNRGATETELTEILKIAIEPTQPTSVDVTHGHDAGRYVSIDVQTPHIREVWASVRRTMQDTRVGRVLSKCCIVVCEGEHGWDDYLLLHHYDASETLDEIGA